MTRYFLLLLFNVFMSISVYATPFKNCDESTGMAGIYPCQKIDLMSHLNIEELGGNSRNSGNDIWGWTDTSTGKEYALMGLSIGTSFVDISDPKNPQVLGILPTATVNSTWRDIKTYKNFAYIVSEAGNHGMQVFDLKQLAQVSGSSNVFVANNTFHQFGSAHNIVINEDSGFAYAVGSSTCDGGLYMMSLQDPSNPTFVGCFSADGYTHDAQCVNYMGPDSTYTGREICFNANEDTITLVDVTDKSAPVQISRTGYSGSQYTHQGWLTEDHRYFLMNDELDEQRDGHKTRSYIWDMLNLDAPQLIGFYDGPKDSIDHNVYIKGNLAYLTNYTSGLSIVDITNIGNANLQEVGNFDTFPENNEAEFDGAWSNYPYFASGNIIVSDINTGLYVLSPNLCHASTATQGVIAQANGDNSIALNWDIDLIAGESYNVYRSEGGCGVDNFEKIAEGLIDSSYIDNTVTGQVKVGYKINKAIVDINDTCESERSVCVEVQTTGNCTIAPAFSGVSKVFSSDTATCGVDLQWQAANSYCGAGVKYNIFKSQDSNFTPDASNKIASAVNSLDFHDVDVYDNEEYYYLVRAIDNENGKEDNNVLKLSDKVHGLVSTGTWHAGAEVGDTGFNAAQKHVAWEQTSNRLHSGTRSYWSESNVNTCNALTSQSMQLSVDESSELSFWTAYDIDYQFDGGVVEVSTKQNVWNPLQPNPDYPNVFRNSGDACGYEFNDKSFTGTNLEWKKHTIDLSEYQGQDVQIRWNYSTDEKNTGEGWYIDDIALTNVQIPSHCETIAAKIQPGLWYDPTHNGHGFVIEPIANSELYFTVFYTYKDDGTPEWYTSLASFENGMLNINMDDETLQRFTYDFSVDPTGQATPLVTDTSIGTNKLSINFNTNQLLSFDACVDQLGNNPSTALATWQIGTQEGSWCVQPLLSESSYPSPDFGATWWTGNDDDGWGLSLAFTGNTIVVVVYYYDSEGQPRWALGQTTGFTVGEEITVSMQEFQGYARNEAPIAPIASEAGTITLKLNSTQFDLNTDGSMSIDINYQGTEGGNWKRTNVPITNFTEPHQ